LPKLLIKDEKKGEDNYIMESISYRLEKPYKFKVVKKKIKKKKGFVLVEPCVASICNADLRYYTGKRRKEALKKKLPMTLLHEGVGRVIDANKCKKFNIGDRVVIIPCIPGYIADKNKFPSILKCCPACRDKAIGENHCSHIHFLSSGFDGLAQSIISHPQECLMKIPPGIPDRIACLSELLSVCYGAIKKENFKGKKIAIIGDGPVAYIFALALIFIAKVKRNNIRVLGINNRHLANFSFVKTINIRKTDIAKYRFDVLFECVGGKEAKDTINNAISLSNPGAKIFLVGVSEDLILVNTRDVLEKKITLIGVSRSSRHDYGPVISSLKQKELKKYLYGVIKTKYFHIRNVQSLKKAFSFAANKNKYWGKILLQFKH